jgi:hypothetical protein
MGRRKKERNEGTKNKYEIKAGVLKYECIRVTGQKFTTLKIRRY